MIGYVYETTNTINGMKYIGKKVSNKFLGNQYLGSGVYIKNAVNKYGKDKFTIKILEKCYTKQELTLCEIKWIKLTDAVNNPNYYNLSEGGEGSNYTTSRRHSIYWRDKISESNRGKVRTFENKQKISNTLKRKIYLDK